MIRYVLAAATLAVLVGAAAPSGAAPRKVVIAEAPANPAALEIPAEIKMPSSIGEITFRHQMHFKDLSVKCADCHHQINASPLNTPHPDYLGSSWINCKTCHNEAQKTARKAYVCSECHQTGPKHIADESLSAKVVTHKQCWKCHAVGTGKEASKGCAKCHSGKKRF